MTVVVDASVVVAGLVDSGPAGVWAEGLLGAEPLLAPHVVLAEAANVLRRATAAHEITADVAALAYRDLLSLRVVLFPYLPFGQRIWDLRANLTAYDAWYVAVAESVGVRLATLDRRLALAPGLGCEVVTAPEPQP